MARPNSGPLTAWPRSASQRVSGPEPVLAAGRRRRQRGEHGPAGLEVGDRLGRDRHGHVLDVVAEPVEQPGGVLPGGDAGGVDVDVRDDGRDEARDPQPAGLAVAGVEERRRTAAAPRTGRRRDDRRGRRAGRRRRGPCAPGCPAVASPTGSPYLGAPLIRPRDGLSPTRPQHDAGIRIDPPPSEPGATGSRPAATAAAAPPEEPPAVRVVSHGVTAGGATSGSV